MQTIALVLQKGGSGKTTLVVHLCAAAAAKERKVLLINLDPQAPASLWADRRGDLPPDVATEHPARLDPALEAARKQGYDLVILDTAPHADQAALRAAKASDLVLVPCRPAVFDIAAICATLDVCDLAKRQAVIVLNAAPVRSRIVAEARQLIEAGGGTVAPVVICGRVAFVHCLAAGRLAAETESDGAAAAEIATLCSHLNP